MAEAKHAFVDDNPYLVYSPNAEMTYDGNSGGGGGGGDTSIFRITVDTETGALSEKAGDLATMCDSGLVYLVYGSVENGNFAVSLLVKMTIEQGSYSFAFASVNVMQQSAYAEIYNASSANDYPVLDEGE